MADWTLDAARRGLALLEFSNQLARAGFVFHVLQPEFGISFAKWDIAQTTLRILVENAYRDAGMPHQARQEVRLRQIGCLIDADQSRSLLIITLNYASDIVRQEARRNAGECYFTGREIRNEDPPSRLS